MDEANKRRSSAAKILLTRVNWNPVRYSDNVGIQFLMELGKIGKEEGVGAEEAINSFLSKISVSQDPFREPFSPMEDAALSRVAARCNLQQKLEDTALIGNIKQSVFSRRAIIGGLGGMTVGRVADYLLDRELDKRNPSQDPKFKESVKELRAENLKAASLIAQEDELRPILAKSNKELTEADKNSIVDLTRDRLKYRDEDRKVREKADSAFKPYKLIEAAVKNKDTLMPVIGTGLGIYVATAGEGEHQAGVKFEAFVKEMDALIDFRLGRSPIPRETVER